MAIYNGSIELISGLIQKNNGDFPLVNAKDVAVYKANENGEVTESRLDTYLDNVGVSEKDKIDIINAAAAQGEEAVFEDSRFKDLQWDVTENSTSILDLSSSVSGLQEQLENFKGDNAELKLTYNEEQSMLYLHTTDEITPDTIITSTVVKGGGGGSTSAYKLTLTALDENTSFSILNGTPGILNFKTELLDNGDPVSNVNINFTLYVNDVVAATTALPVGEQSWDITEFLKLGNNNIRLLASFTDVSTGVIVTNSKRWGINVVEMYITSTFDDTTTKSGAVTFNYTPYGDLGKTVYFYLDNELFTSVVTSLTNRTLSISIPAQAHGSHTLEVYCTGKLSATEEIESEHLYYDIMWVEEGNETPIIRALIGTKNFQQYSNIPVYYSVWSPKTTNPVTLYVDDKAVSNLTVDQLEQTWDYRPMDFGTKTLKIETTDGVSKSFTIEVEEFPYEISPVTAGLDLDFNPVGRTNQDSDYNVFYNNVEGKENAYGWELSDNFDWVNGGWQTDENGEAYFCVKAGTTATFNYLLFNDNNTVAITGTSSSGGISYTKGNGKEFKLIFKTTNAANSQATWLSCVAPALNGADVGIKMDVHNGYVSSNLETLAIPYSEEDIIEFDMNIVPATFNGSEIDYTVKDIPMIITYEDGSPAQPLVITNPTTSFKQVEAVPIVIGSDYCDVHIYRMKAYANFLLEEDIKNNFIADARSGSEIARRYLTNDIYDKVTGKLTPESVAEACPDLRVIKISAPRFTNDKKDKVEDCTIQMIHKNGDPVYDNWTAVNAIHNGQGTSSNEYGYAARNLELNLKVKDANVYTLTSEAYNKDGELLPIGTTLKGDEAEEIFDAEGNPVDITTISTVYLKPGTKITLGDGTVVKKVSLTRDSVPTNYFNVKVNVASTDHANNALLQKRYDRYLPYVSLAKMKDPKVKNTMNFYNCVIFVQEYDETQDASGNYTIHQEFNDTEYHFYSIGNIGDSKKTDDTRANDPDDTNEFCVEIMDWNRVLSSFPQDTFAQAKAERFAEKDKEGNITGYIFLKDSNLGEDGILYEKTEDGYVLSKDTTIDTENAEKYYVDILENDDFSEDFTYGFRYLNDDEDPEQIAAAKAKWIEFYRFVTKDLTTNGVEDADKVAAWKKEFEDWFILDAALYYYLFTLRYTMVDNRAKNSFWHYGKCTDGKYRFDFWDYDNDTALGIDNAGKLEMTYGVEDNDTDEAGTPYFRANDSTFFTRVANYFANELEDYYRLTLEAKNPDVFSSTSLINEFDAWQSQFPEELWRLQYERIYKRTFVGGYGKEWDNRVNPAQINKKAEQRFLTQMMNGKKKYQRRQFERNQDAYMSSKFEGSTNFGDIITLRGAGNVAGADPTLTITPYSNMYINLYNATDSRYFHQRCYAGQTYTVKYPSDVLDFIYIRGASYIQSLGDLSLMYLQTATLNSGTRLKTIIIGNAAEGYDNKSLKDAGSIIGSGNKLLEYLDLRNISGLTGNLTISGIPSLKELYAQGTDIKSVAFANNGLIEKAYLPASISELQMVNLHFIKELEIAGYDNLTSLLIENCPTVDTLSIVQSAVNLKQLRISGVDWTLADTTLLNKLLKCYDIGSDSRVSSVSGKVHVPVIRQTEIQAYAEAWPELSVTYDSVLPQYLVTFKDWDGSVLTETWVDIKENCPDPIETGVIPTPTRESTAQFNFTFAGWDSSLENVTTHRTITATYTSEVRYYTVEWYLGITSSEAAEAKVTVEYGQPAIYPKEIPTRPNNYIVYYLFNGWDTVTTFVDRDMKVTALWQSGSVEDDQINDVANFTPAQIAAVIGEGKADYFFNDGSDSSRPATVYHIPVGYMPTYNEENETVLAENLELDGKTCINTGIKLFDEDKAFTIALDFTPYYASSLGYILDCYAGGSSRGVSVSAQKEASPQVRWHSATSIPVNSNHIISTDKVYREIIVIRKQKGNNNLYVYTNDRFSNDPVQERIIQYSGDFTALENTLTLGGRVNAVSGAISGYANGKIHYAKLWLDDLGEIDCKKICNWTYGTEAFKFVGTQRYYYENGVESSASFVAMHLLEETLVYQSGNLNETNHAGGWGASNLRLWLNNKFLAAIDPLWVQLIKPVKIKYLYGGGDTETWQNLLECYDRLYVPAYAEVFEISQNDSTNSVYLQEVEEGRSRFTDFADAASRVRTLGPDGAAAKWWTRTPNVTHSGSTSKPKYVITVAEDGAVSTTGNYSDSSFGLCISFSM